MTISISKTRSKSNTIENRIRSRGLELGLDDIRIGPASIPVARSASYHRFIELDHHGEMDWLKSRAKLRQSPTCLWPDARSVVMAGLSYGPSRDPLPELDRKDRGYISIYARHRDYHDVLKGKLKQLAGYITSQTAASLKVFVDTAPILEKPLAQQSGLGWQGKHTNLLSRKLGNWFFLGGILLDQNLVPDHAERDHCGSCRRCLDICPTGAFPRAYELDARRCISYLTIEHKSQIPPVFRKAMGNRIYGCDDCLAVCPWNKFAGLAHEAKLQAREDMIEMPLADLARLDDRQFRQRFSGSPIKRIGRDRFVRNVLVAIGNSGEQGLISVAEELLDDGSPLVRGMAVWALGELDPVRAVERVQQYRRHETEPTVLQEWHILRKHAFA